MNRNNPNTSTFYPKKLTELELYKMGINPENFKMVNTLEDLRNNPPNIIIAKCKKTVQFLQNNFTKQTIFNKISYVMGADIYLRLHYDTRSNTEILKPADIKFKNVYRSYVGQNLDNKSILVFRQGGIGDLLFIQPNLNYLKQKYPTCTIKFACGPQYQSMVKEWDCVDKVLDLPFTLNELFDADYHCLFEGVIERCKESETICCYNLFTKWMGLNLSDDLLIPKQEPNKISLENCKKYLSTINVNEKDFILVQMRASSPIRTPDPKMWIKLINILTEKGYNILITDNPLNTKGVDEFIKKLDNQEKVFNFSEQSKVIADTISMSSLAKLVLSIDSALIHISISVGTKAFGIYGPFPGNVRLSTYPKNLCDWLDVKKEGCSPCFQHGMQPCKSSVGSIYSPCYNNLDYNECVEKIERLIQK